jgi:hypothetical protein
MNAVENSKCCASKLHCCRCKAFNVRIKMAILQFQNKWTGRDTRQEKCESDYSPRVVLCALHDTPAKINHRVR